MNISAITPQTGTHTSPFVEERSLLLPAQEQKAILSDIERILHTDSFDIEMLPFLLILAASDYKEQATSKYNHLIRERQTLQYKEKEKLFQLELHEQDAKRVGFINRVEQSFSSAGLLFCGISNIASGNIVSGGIASFIGAMNALDQLFDDSAKKTVATWFSSALGEDQDIWAYRLSLFSNIAAYAVGFGLEGGKILPIAMKVTDATLAAIKGGIEYKHTLNRALYLELDYACNAASKNIESLIEDVQRNAETISQFYQKLAAIQKSRANVSAHINRVI